MRWREPGGLGGASIWFVDKENRRTPLQAYHRLQILLSPGPILQEEVSQKRWRFLVSKHVRSRCDGGGSQHSACVCRVMDEGRGMMGDG